MLKAVTFGSFKQRSNMVSLHLGKITQDAVDNMGWKITSDQNYSL
jgi:hypothetical protein